MPLYDTGIKRKYDFHQAMSEQKDFSTIIQLQHNVTSHRPGSRHFQAITITICFIIYYPVVMQQR
jgi:hypothetical protein